MTRGYIKNAASLSRRCRHSVISNPSSWLLSSSRDVPRLIALAAQVIRFTSSKSSSSSSYLARQQKDPFVRSRNLPNSSSPSETFVSRSAFKLLQLHETSVKSNRGGLIRPAMTVVDLGASPGGWLQACSSILSGGHVKTPRRKLTSGKKTKLIGLDLLPLHPNLKSLPLIEFIQGDFLDPFVQAKLSNLLKEDKVDLVLSDMLSNLSGSPIRDAQSSIDLCQVALQFAVKHLRREEEGEKGRTSLIMKCLQSDLSEQFGRDLKRFFRAVRWEKPSSSRAESREGYWVCSGFKGGALADEEDRGSSGEKTAGQDDELYF